VALLLAPSQRRESLAQLTAALSAVPAERLADPQLEALRSRVPAARGLPLLRRIARGEHAAVGIDYLEKQRLHLEVSPCH
ncbi:MAG TPA: hypothetical protein VH135_06380, partial [Steroidobacteraceae bacterium]|nr:hypothetical protein [Steroidobacteraceae bacterium]